MSRLSGVSARMSPRGCYEETAPVEVQLKQPKSYVMSRDLRSFRTGCGAARHRMAPDGAGSDAKEPLQIANNVSHGWLRRQLDGGILCVNATSPLPTLPCRLCSHLANVSEASPATVSLSIWWHVSLTVRPRRVTLTRLRLSAHGFLLVFCGNHIAPERTAVEVWVYDRKMDERTYRSIA